MLFGRTGGKSYDYGMPQPVGSFHPQVGTGTLPGPPFSAIRFEELLAVRVTVLAAKPVITRENTKARTRVVFIR